MLKEIYCDKFMENGKIRPKIQFHKGLNTIVGARGNGAKSENSVGKSTLLAIIDFCFGGKSFAESKAVEIIGGHTICFAFEFNGATHHFMRTVGKNSRLFKCDEDYSNPQNCTLDEFSEWLKEQYKLDGIELSFRQIAGTYSRFYGENDISPKEILRAYGGQSGSDQVRNLEKLFEEYPLIKAEAERVQEFDNRNKVKTQASKLRVEIADFKKTDRAETAEKIAALEARKKELLENQQSQAAELDAQKAQELAALQAKRQRLSSARSKLLTRIENIENADFETMRPSKASYDALLEFFPNADIKRIEEIDAFHEKLCAILAEEHEEALEDYHAELADVQGEIENIERQISASGNGQDFTTTFLLEFAKVQGELDRLNARLEEDEREKSADEQAKIDRRNLKEKEAEILSRIKKAVNKKLSAMSKAVLGENAGAIQFSFPTNASYSLGLPLDDGTGTDYTSLILFDLSVLALTKLPALIHDSYLLANIRGSRLENLIKTYAAATDKQIFLAIDETEKLSEETANLVNREDIKAATLWHGGGELYGFYWGGKKPVREW